MFDSIILTCVWRLNGERTISGIFNLLVGKRSSQTLQDARGYQLESYFGIYKSLDRLEFENHFSRLVQAGYVKKEKEAFPSITEKGIDYLENKETHSFIHFKGLRYHQQLETFEKRLFLLVQTFTNVARGKRSFIPIIDDPDAQQWVKKSYTTNQKFLTDKVEDLYQELHQLLSGVKAIEAELFTYRLTGNGIIGLTREQLMNKFALSIQDVDVCIQHVLYFIFCTVKQKPHCYPALNDCLEDLDDSTLITQSAKRTYQHIQQGWDIESIIRKRRLKKSTIQDHIVEAALVIPQFSIEPFLNEDDKRVIVEVANKLDTQRLKLIHQALAGEYDYFQIRLALAKERILSERGNNYAKA